MQQLIQYFHITPMWSQAHKHSKQTIHDRSPIIGNVSRKLKYFLSTKYVANVHPKAGFKPSWILTGINHAKNVNLSVKISFVFHWTGIYANLQYVCACKCGEYQVNLSKTYRRGWLWSGGSKERTSLDSEAVSPIKLGTYRKLLPSKWILYRWMSRRGWRMTDSMTVSIPWINGIALSPFHPGIISI